MDIGLDEQFQKCTNKQDSALNQTFQVMCSGEPIVTYMTYSTGLWGLVNNAGKLSVGMIELQSLDSFKSIADVNLWGAIFVTQTFLPLVKKARGRIVNIGSILGEMKLLN